MKGRKPLSTPHTEGKRERGGLSDSHQKHKGTKHVFIYFRISFYGAGVSSAPSGRALGSKKSGCCRSFKYLGGVRMWVEPTEGENPERSVKMES